MREDLPQPGQTSPRPAPLVPEGLGRLVLLGLLLSAMIAQEAALPDPSPEEAALLQFVNAHRTRRWQYDDDIVRMLPQFAPSGFDVAQAFTLSYEPKQALVANPQLAAAARALLTGGVGMPTAGYPDPATARFGYPGRPLWPENTIQRQERYAGPMTLALIMRGVKSAELGYAGSMLFQGETYGKAAGLTSVMSIMRLPWQEVGIAIERGSQGLDVAMVYGRGVPRKAGGVVYADANRNLRYDHGEGLAGATISCGSATMTTTAGGVWWASLPDAAAGSVTFNMAGLKAVRTYAAGTDNAVIDWRIPSADELKLVDELLVHARKAAATRKPDAESWPTPLIDLYISTLMLDLDSGRQEQLSALAQAIVDEFTSMRSKLLALLDEDPKTFAREHETLRKRYPGQAARWFKEVQEMAALRRQVVAACTPETTAKPPDPGKRAAKTEVRKPTIALPEALAKARQASCDPALRAQYDHWEQQLSDAALAKGKGK